VQSWSLPVDGSGQVDAGAAAAEAARLLEPAAAPARAAQSAPRPAVEERAPAEQRVPAATPAAEAEPRRASAPPAETVAAAPARAAGTRATPRPAETSALRAGGALGAVELGMGALQRRLTYQGVGTATGTLRDFRDGTLVVPAARAELFPWASSEGAWWAGFGVFAAYGRSVGFQTEDSSTGVTHDSTYSALDAGIAYRVRPLGGLGLRLVPAVWYRSLSFEVSPAAGARIGGLPDATLAGVAAGLGVEVPVTRRLALLADASYTRWTSAGELVGSSYFSSGSANGVDVDAGASVELAGRWSLRVLASYGVTLYSLGGTSSYAATGATDRYLGVRSALRARF
jgi:hypothetical protein